VYRMHYLHRYHAGVPPMALIAPFARVARSTNRCTPHNCDHRSQLQNVTAVAVAEARGSVLPIEPVGEELTRGVMPPTLDVELHPASAASATLCVTKPGSTTGVHRVV
jgi:hypothetical protein